MTAQTVDVTARSLSHAAKPLKTTVFCYFFTLYSAKAVGNDRAVGSALALSGRKRPLKKNFLSVPLKKNKKLEFHFDPGKHSLQVSAKSIEESGCGVEWVKFPLVYYNPQLHWHSSVIPRFCFHSDIFIQLFVIDYCTLCHCALF
jgi:hypothetical protein